MPSSATDVAKALAGFGDIVEIETSDELPTALTCTDRYDCQRWRGGIAIFRNSDGARCTWGFQASRNSYLQMITAGHCALTGGKFSHDGVTIGSNGVGKNALKPDTFEGVDAERTWVDGPDYPTTQNVLYQTDSNKFWGLTSAKANTLFYLNMPVDKAGSSTNYSTGYLDDLEVEYRIDPGFYYPDCSPSNVLACPEVIGAHSNTWVGQGDSGAPVFVSASQSFLGTVSAGGGSAQPYNSGANLYFARQEDIKAALGLDFWCTTGGCP